MSIKEAFIIEAMIKKDGIFVSGDTTFIRVTFVENCTKIVASIHSDYGYET